MDKKTILPRLNFVDKTISFFDPKAALRRWKARAALSFLSKTSGYITPGNARRSMRGWNPANQSADEDTLNVLENARAACRDLFMNSTLGSGALRRIRTNVVGSGLTLQSRVDRELLGLSDEEADVWESNTEREFALWAESKDCDAARRLTFKEQQGLALLSTLMNGDVFAILPYVKNTNSLLPYSLRVKLVEADMVSNPNMAMDEKKIAGGVEQDGMGAPVAYWFHKTKFGLSSLEFGSWQRIPAFGEESGRRNVLHLMDQERVGQRRGMPLLATVIEPLKQIQRLTEAELMASVIASFFTVFIKSTTGQSGFLDQYTEEESVLDQSGDPDSAGRDATKRDDNLMELGSGIINELAEDQDISIADPQRPNQNFNDFFVSIVKQIGASIEMPYEQLLMVFQSSYSASRAALLEAWKFYRMRRVWLACNFCQPIYEEWFTEAVSIGRIAAPGYFDDPLIRKAWTGTLWAGQGQGQIDPVKETKAARMRIAANLSTYEDEYLAMSGGDWEQTIVRLSRQNRKLEQNNLPLITSESDTDTESDREGEAGGSVPGEQEQ